MTSIVQMDYSQILSDKFQFFYVISQKNVLFEWRKLDSDMDYKLMVNVIKTNTYNNGFYRFDNGKIIIISILNNNIIYAIGVNIEVPSQLVEAFLDLLIERFLETFDLNVLLTFDVVSPSIFEHFNTVIEKILDEFNDLDLVKGVNVFCNVCNEIFPLIVKKKLIQNSNIHPVPIVHIHGDHSVICYIDQNFKARGSRKVNFG